MLSSIQGINILNRKRHKFPSYPIALFTTETLRRMQICHAVLHESCIPLGIFGFFFLLSILRTKAPGCKQWTKGITYHLSVNLAQVTRTYLSVGCYQIAKDELLTTSRHLCPFFSLGRGARQPHNTNPLGFLQASSPLSLLFLAVNVRV